MSEYTDTQKRAMTEYKRPFIAAINNLDIVDVLQLQKAKDNTYVCPCCGSGSGPKGTGLQVTKDHKRVTCFANVDCPLNGEGHGQDIYGALKAVTGKTGDAILKEYFPEYNVADALKTGQTVAEIEQKAQKAINIPARTEKATERPDYTNYYRLCRERLTDSEALDYLSLRGLSYETAYNYWIGYDPAADPANAPGAMADNVYKPHPCKRLIIPFDASHYLGRRTDGESEYKKINNKSFDPSDSVPLFNIKALYNEAGRPVFITEGAISALSIIEAGSEALALNSANNTGILLERIREKRPTGTLIICLDEDTTGQKAQKTLSEQLQLLNVPFTTANICEGYNDPNDALTNDRTGFINAVATVERNTTKPYNTADYINNLMASEVAKLKEQSSRKTGFINLDKEHGSIYAGLYVIGGISSVGKTTFISQLADQMAAQGQHVLFYSMEQSRLEMVSKSIARQTAANNPANAVSSIQIRTGAQSDAITRATADYLHNVGDRESIIEGNFNCNVGFISSYTRQYMTLNEVRPVVIIDYLQVIQPTPDPITGKKITDTRQIVDYNVTELKRLSRSLEIPVFVVSSVNRSNYLTPIDYESFKESGGIEYTADVVWGLQLAAINSDVFDGDPKANIKSKRERLAAAKEADPREIELVCLKNRYGKSRYSVQFVYYAAYDYFAPKMK